MKIKSADVKRLREALNNDFVKEYAECRWNEYWKMFNIPGTPIYQRNYSDRWRWDVFHNACIHDSTLIKDLYSYLTDNNIIVALRKLLPLE